MAYPILLQKRQFTLNALGITNRVGVTKFSIRLTPIAIQSDGKILVGGNFTNYAETSGRSYLIRLNSDGTLDTAFCVAAVDGSKFNNSINSIAVQSDGKILIGGNFTNYAGTANRNRFIRLNSDGTTDTAFCANASDSSKFNSLINSIAIQSDGKILVGGEFVSYAGTAGRSYLIRLNSNGSIDNIFCSNASDSNKFNNLINSIAIQSDGRILVGGQFFNYGTAGRSYLIRLNSDGTTDTAFCANASDSSKFNSTINSLAIQSDGKIVVSGNFINYAGTANRNQLIRLNSNGTLDTAFCNNASDGRIFNNIIYSIFIQSDGKIFVGGDFINYPGAVGRSYLIRLNSDGTTDTAFCANASDSNKGNFNSFTNVTAVQSDGKILVGGAFANYAGTTGRSRLIRLNLNGTLDTTFCANASDNYRFNDRVNSIAIQSDGKILIGGGFTNYAGTTGRSYLIRLNSDGTLDTAFCNNASDGAKFGGSGVVFSIAVQSDGKVLVGGQFTNYAGTANRSRLIRLNSDGTTDTAFCVAAVDGNKFNDRINSIAVQSDGKILVGGNFTNYAGTANRNRFIRLNSDGTTDTAFCNNASDSAKFSTVVYSIAVQSDGKVLVGGQFTNYAGTAGRSYLIRLNSDGTTDTAFCNNASDGNLFNNIVFSIVIQPNNEILVTGSFTERLKLLATTGTTVSVLPVQLRSATSDETRCIYTNNSIFMASSAVNQAYGALLVLDRFYNVI